MATPPSPLKLSISESPVSVGTPDGSDGRWDTSQKKKRERVSTGKPIKARKVVIERSFSVTGSTELPIWTDPLLTLLTADGERRREKERREKVCPRCKNALIDDSLMVSGCDRFQIPTGPPHRRPVIQFSFQYGVSCIWLLLDKHSHLFSSSTMFRHHNLFQVPSNFSDT
jgi:hypothetical protein